MNDFIDIATLQGLGVQNVPMDKPQGLKPMGSGDLVSFLSHVAEHLKSTSEAENNISATEQIPEDIKILSEKIAELLQNGEMLPE